ncbi:MAG TPA: hypothetical protein VIV40_24920 [Kofleriaceae bacterium]
MRNLLLDVLVLGIACSAAACSPYDPDLGSSPFLCGPADQEQRCPDGYACMTTSAGDYCLSAGGMVPVDGNNLNCADDSALEPNDSIAQAFQTPVATTKNTLTFAGLAICPAGDKDDYSVTITTANQNLEVIIEYDAATGADLQGSILNSGGQAIANASPVSGMMGMRRAYTPNLPTGVYYASVFGPAMGSLTTNNYKLTINVTGP